MMVVVEVVAALKGACRWCASVLVVLVLVLGDYVSRDGNALVGGDLFESTAMLYL